MSAIDLRWLTACAQMLVGISILVSALWVWWMPLARRATLLGPLLTGDGMRLFLRTTPLGFIFGLWLFVAGVSKFTYYMRWHGDVGNEVANSIGIFEALLSLGVVFLLITAALRVRKGGGNEQ